jgi:hypothetical protein
MNKNLFAIALFLMGSLMLTTSCDKDDDPMTNEDLIIGTWRLSAFTVSPELPFIGSNVYSQIPDCTKDDLSIFEDNGVFKVDEGASKCNPNDPQTITGSYTFNPDMTVLTINDGSETESWDISEISDSQMVATYEESDTGVVYTYTLTFTKQ